ncbi:MAG: gene transfer agent family protein [Roseinatronobacter sp.]
MINPHAGEVSLSIDGRVHVMRLTLGALAEMETALDGSALDLVQRFETGRFSARDVLALIVAGLRGGGWQGTAADLTRAEIEDGLPGAARKAAELLARAFTPPA